MSTEGDARSSSASHFSKDYETASVGTAEHVFYGVALSNDVLAAPPFQILGLAVILLILILQTRKISYFINTPLIAAIIGAIAASAPQTTWIPLLTTIVYTRTAYPYMVVIPHCILANATYRKLHTSGSNKNVSHLQSLIASFFLYGFGGSIVSDVLMGLPVTALSHPRIVPCHLLGWILVWCSPGDWVYGSLTAAAAPNKTTIFSLLLAAMEAIDAVTTPMGRISRSARELRNKMTAPVVAGLLAGVGGGTLRKIAGEPGSSLQALESAFWKTLSYSLLWWYLAVHQCNGGFRFFPDVGEKEFKEWNHCGSYNGSEETRVIIVGAHAAWALLVEMGIVSGHPFIWICKKVFVDAGSQVSRTMGWGPAPASNDDENDDDDSAKKND